MEDNELRAFASEDDKSEKAVEIDKMKSLTFTIGSEVYGVQIEKITTIIGLQPITFIPNQADYIKGVINLRGQIIPVVEIRKKFKKDIIEYDDRTCIIVVSKEDMIVGLIVDRIWEVFNISDEEIAFTPDFNKEKKIPYIKGIAHCGGTIITLLDIDKLLEHEEILVATKG